MPLALDRGLNHDKCTMSQQSGVALVIQPQPSAAALQPQLGGAAQLTQPQPSAGVPQSGNIQAHQGLAAQVLLPQCSAGAPQNTGGYSVALQQPAQQSAQQAGQASHQQTIPDVKEDRVKVAINLVLDGKDLRETSLKKLRHAVAAHLQLGKPFSDGSGHDGLEGKKDWFNDLAQPIVDKLAFLLPSMQGPPEWLTQEDGAKRLNIYLVTFSAALPDTAQNAPTPLRTLNGLRRKDIRDAVLDALANPESSCNGGRPRQAVVPLKLVTFLEIPLHFHVALQLREKSSFLAFKKALRSRSRLASHWSTSHTEFCSVLRYCTHTSDKKLAVDEEALSWSHNGDEVDLFGESNEHYSAAARKKRREIAVMRPDPTKKQKRESFTKLDLTSLALAENLKTPAQVMAFVKKRGSSAMMEFVHQNQGRLKEFLLHATEWRDAEEVASFERETDWDLVQRVAKQSCVCQGACKWWEQAQSFFERNQGSIDRLRLTACFLDVLRFGPSKTRRVPLLIGPSNSGKSTIWNPVDKLFGESYVFHTPAVASCAFANLALLPKRFLYLDEFSPVEYAACPDKQPAVPKSLFLKLFQGSMAEVQVSQAHNNGHKDMKWSRGVVITAKADGLWNPMRNVSAEDIRHMKNRVEQFSATTTVDGQLVEAPACKETFCKWLIEDSQAWASRSVPTAITQPPPPSTDSVIPGFSSFLAELAVPTDIAAALHKDALALGATSVAELRFGDWTALASWSLLRPLQQRRIGVRLGHAV